MSLVPLFARGVRKAYHPRKLVATLVHLSQHVWDEIMSACKLTEDTSAKASLKGTTLFAKGDDCIAETAVYLSKANARKSVSNVILFFHGWHVAKIEENVFSPDTAGGENKPREGVDAADRDVVLIVPFLGRQEKTGGSIGLGNLKRKVSKPTWTRCSI